MHENCNPNDCPVSARVDAMKEKFDRYRDKKGNGMEKEKTNVPYIVYEGEMARAERRDKRQWIVIIALIVALFASNIGWLVYESQFETYTYAQDGDGLNNINSGEQGDVLYGPETENQEEKER